MPQLIRPSSVKITTKEGEIQVSITLDLNINLNNGIEVSAQALPLSPQVPKKELTKMEENGWEIPDFEASPKIKFGR